MKRFFHWLFVVFRGLRRDLNDPRQQMNLEKAKFVAANPWCWYGTGTLVEALGVLSDAIDQQKAVSSSELTRLRARVVELERDAGLLPKIVAAANAAGWNGVTNSKLLDVFIEELATERDALQEQNKKIPLILKTKVDEIIREKIRWLDMRSVEKRSKGDVHAARIADGAAYHIRSMRKKIIGSFPSEGHDARWQEERESMKQERNPVTNGFMRNGKDIGDSWRDRYRASKDDQAVLSGVLRTHDFSMREDVGIHWEHLSVFNLHGAFAMPDPFDDDFVWVFGEHDPVFVVPIGRSFENKLVGKMLEKSEPRYAELLVRLTRKLEEKK